MFPSVSGEDYVRAMAQHAAAVCAVTTRHDGRSLGLTATAVCSLSAAPPRLIVCVNSAGTTHAGIAAAGRFCVNVLAEDQVPIARAFADRRAPERDRFALGRWTELETGSPVLADAAAALDCRVAGQLAQGSHSIFVGAVVAVSIGPGQDPLLYAGRRFRQLRRVFAGAGAGIETLHV